MSGTLVRSMLVILSVAAMLRIGLAVGRWERPPVDDERAYDTLARSIVAGRGYTSETALGFVHPGNGASTSLWGCLQPLYLAAIYATVGPSPGWAYLANALVGLVTVAVAMLLAIRAGPGTTIGATNRVVVVSGVLVAVDVYLLKLTTTLLTETLYIALVVLSLWVLVRWQEVPGSWRRAGAAGVVLGLASLTRGQAFYFVPVALAWLWFERWRVRAGLMRAELAAFAGALGCVLLPWVARNAWVHDQPVFLDTKAGWNLYGYLHPDFDPLLGNRVAVPPEVLQPDKSESERNQILKRHARQFVLDDPAHVLWMAPRKLWLLWSPLAGRLTDPKLAPIKLGFVLPLELLALVGVLRSRAGAPVLRLFVGLLGFYVAVHCVMTGGPRFRVPLDPALAVFAGCALVPRRQSRMSSSTPA